jgi:hypothetical protein
MKNILTPFITIFFTPLLHAQSRNTGFGAATPGSKLTMNGSDDFAYNNITAATYSIQPNDK